MADDEIEALREAIEQQREEIREALAEDLSGELRTTVLVNGLFSTAESNWRLAIGILRTAASKANRENRNRITDDILLNAAEDARAQIKQKSLDSLTPHQRIVYNIVRDHGPIGPSEIHERYTGEVDDPRTKRTVQTYLSKMEQYNLLKAEGTSRDREYSLVDSAAASPMQ